MPDSSMNSNFLLLGQNDFTILWYSLAGQIEIETQAFELLNVRSMYGLLCCLALVLTHFVFVFADSGADRT